MVRYPELNLRPYPDQRSRFSRLFSTWRRIITASVLAVSALLFVVSLLYSKLEVHIRRIDVVTNPIVLPPAKIDHQYQPPHRFEIVIAHYSEPLAELNNVLESLQRLPNLRQLSPIITLYSKNPSISDDTYQSLVPSARVIRHANNGREGGTYLHHLLSRYNELAEHTLFMQAEVHNLPYFLRHIEEFFDPERTGFLPLSFTGRTCELSRCVDEFGYRETRGDIPALYMRLYDQLPERGRISINYKGQFIVSAKRARGVKKDVLELLHQTVESEKRGRGFGYTLERIWGFVFNCADGEMAVRCGRDTFWKGRGEKDIDSCSCLDPEIRRGNAREKREL
ncbi:hypothetical protein BZA77DRAFT_49066 [Pyronema omphalodes]|nr:hypothetical protein BZA77DRAFT_49066 [Pyronema omphalodes]